MSARIVQLVSLVGFAIISLFVLPWLKRTSRANALVALLAAHVGRVSVLFFPAAQAAGYPISNAAVTEAVTGDLLGATLAAAAIIALLRRSRLGIPLTWLLLIETLIDFAAVIHRRVVEPPTVDPSGPLFVVVAIFAPLLLVTLPLLLWQLLARRREPLSARKAGGGVEVAQ